MRNTILTSYSHFSEQAILIPQANNFSLITRISMFHITVYSRATFIRVSIASINNVQAPKTSLVILSINKQAVTKLIQEKQINYPPLGSIISPLNKPPQSISFNGLWNTKPREETKPLSITPWCGNRRCHLVSNVTYPV